MKKIYIVFGIVCIGLIANSSHSQKVEEVVKIDLPCYNTKELFKSLREKYKESPIIMGKADDEAESTMSVWLNPMDNDWTIIATKNELSCVVGTGTDMKIIPARKGTNI